MNKFLKFAMLICGAAMILCGILVAVTGVTVGKTAEVIILVCYGLMALSSGFRMKE